MGSGPYGGFTVTGTAVRAALKDRVVRASVAKASCRSTWARAMLSYDGSGNPGVIVATTDGGNIWSTQPVSLSGLTSLSSMSCPQALDCWVFASDPSGTPVVLATTDGGTHGALRAFPPVWMSSAASRAAEAHRTAGRSAGTSLYTHEHHRQRRRVRYHRWWYDLECRDGSRRDRTAERCGMCLRLRLLGGWLRRADEVGIVLGTTDGGAT